MTDLKAYGIINDFNKTSAHTLNPEDPAFLRLDGYLLQTLKARKENDRKQKRRAL